MLLGRGGVDNSILQVSKEALGHSLGGMFHTERARLVRDLEQGGWGQLTVHGVHLVHAQAQGRPSPRALHLGEDVVVILELVHGQVALGLVALASLGAGVFPIATVARPIVGI
jgi:hypothetical protein